LKIPNGDAAIIPIEKIRDYLLSPTHPVGRYKAAVFRQLGFEQSQHERFEVALRTQLRTEVMPIKELDTVVVTTDLPAYGLRAGDLGAVVQVYPYSAFEVEFVTAAGGTQAVVTLRADQLRAVGKKDLLAVRKLDAA